MSSLSCLFALSLVMTCTSLVGCAAETAAGDEVETDTDSSELSSSAWMVSSRGSSSGTASDPDQRRAARAVAGGSGASDQECAQVARLYCSEK